MSTVQDYQEAIRAYQVAHSRIRLLIQNTGIVLESFKDWEQKDPGAVIEILDSRIRNWPTADQLRQAVLSRKQASQDVASMWTDLARKDRLALAGPTELKPLLES